MIFKNQNFTWEPWEPWELISSEEWRTAPFSYRFSSELMEGEEDAKELDKELPNDGDKEDGDASNVEIGTIRSFLALP